MTHEWFYVLHFMCSCNAALRALNKLPHSLGREMLCLGLPQLQQFIPAGAEDAEAENSACGCSQLCLLPAPAPAGWSHHPVSDRHLTSSWFHLLPLSNFSSVFYIKNPSICSIGKARGWDLQALIKFTLRGRRMLFFLAHIPYINFQQKCGFYSIYNYICYLYNIIIAI